MGVLDDAIREHLELKRRHGAGEDEIARKEAEALGPARRGPAPEAGAAAPVAEPAAEAGAAAPQEEDAGAAVPDAPPPLADDREPAAPVDTPSTSMADAAAALGEAPPPEVPLAETEPVPAGEEPARAEPEPTIDVPAEVEPPAAIEPAEPVDAAHPPVHDVDRDPAAPPPPVPGATQEFDTLNARDEDEPAAAGDDDVLEETPEFLRETPEHDRLWFEQKPPRDFDLED